MEGKPQTGHHWNRTLTVKLNTGPRNDQTDSKEKENKKGLSHARFLLKLFNKEGHCPPLLPHWRRWGREIGGPGG